MKKYRIPHNFGQEGNIGQFSLQAVIEACVYVVVEVVVMYYFPIFGPVIRFFIGAFLVMFTLILILYWGELDTPSELLVRFVKFHMGEKKYGLPSDKEVADREHRIIKKKQLQMKAMRASEAKRKRIHSKSKKNTGSIDDVINMDGTIKIPDSLSEENESLSRKKKEGRKSHESHKDDPFGFSMETGVDRDGLTFAGKKPKEKQHKKKKKLESEEDMTLDMPSFFS